MRITADLKKIAESVFRTKKLNCMLILPISELFNQSELKIFWNKTLTEFTQNLKNNQSQQSDLTYKK